MNSIARMDKVILVKEMNEKFKKVGEVFEVANIINDHFVLRSEQTKVAVGVVTFEDFDKYFVQEGNFKGWTEWMPIVGFDGQSDCDYRTNRKKVQVRFLANNVRAESCCNKSDNFNLAFGIRMAYLRCLNKSYEARKAELEAELKKANSEIAENESIIKKMVNSLGA